MQIYAQIDSDIHFIKFSLNAFLLYMLVAMNPLRGIFAHSLVVQFALTTISGINVATASCG